MWYLNVVRQKSRYMSRKELKKEGIDKEAKIKEGRN